MADPAELAKRPSSSAGSHAADADRVARLEDPRSLRKDPRRMRIRVPGSGGSCARCGWGARRHLRLMESDDAESTEMAEQDG